MIECYEGAPSLITVFVIVGPIVWMQNCPQTVVYFASYWSQPLTVLYKWAPLSFVLCVLSLLRPNLSLSSVSSLYTSIPFNKPLKQISARDGCHFFSWLQLMMISFHLFNHLMNHVINNLTKNRQNCLPLFSRTHGNNGKKKSSFIY